MSDKTINFEKKNSKKEKTDGYISINWGRQGAVIFIYILVLFGYYGIIANIIMVNEYGKWISYTEMDRTILIWPYKTYLQTFFTPILLLFLTSFLLTYKEDIPFYGIKASLWLVPSILLEGFAFYGIMFGFSIDPLIWQFFRAEGYLNILLLFIIVISGSLSGWKLKKHAVKRSV
ncbi:MAG: hypothetical protein ACTSWY_12420 [Promethearchaeota archaeon]